MDGFLVQSCSIPANHVDMCKFTDSNDIGYQRLSGHLLSVICDVEEKQAAGE